ncbi:suppressor of fused domain protein [Pseudoroseomonas cervicalis]|uniref:suppressor of fused domain protein n=1 Tax=Teichococcus cervicalis TaxID=204525 RepID=UPI0022F15DC9|nr:suppressor of fused domain protein [Pseudoroseomonas cervicalis]WBV44833.1 suppressor of fused domain protein [Pseudoroseomonas cervicalis]
MGLFDRLRALLGGRPAAPPGALAPGQAPEAAPDSAAAEASQAARDAYWAGIGQVERDVLAPLISPGLMGGPAWPTLRQAYRVIRRAESLILATDGLSDPFDGVSGGGNGFGMELFLETAEIDPALAGQPGDVSGLGRSWAFEILQNVAASVAGAGGVMPMLQRHGVLSMELPGVSQAHSLPRQLPPGFATADDSLGVLIGGPAPDFAVQIPGMPLSPAQAVPVVLLRAEELEALRQGGAEARRALAEALGGAPQRHRSSLSRGALA